MDIGKHHHHAVVVDADGERTLSRRVANDEADLLALIADVDAVAGEVVWAIDLQSSESALLVCLLLGQGQKVVYLPGITVNRAASSYRGWARPTPKMPTSSPTKLACVGP